MAGITQSTPGRKPRTEPSDPEKVSKIVYLRDIQNWHWNEISLELGISRQGLFELYQRWRNWAHGEKIWDLENL